ncbi:spore germination protein [Bacillus haynesii]|uniref:spore germination protein n=1 Tax=Bacillus haynesii TaxID=1925021 RepID=UPI0015F5A7E6|nr:spore germination protein [Bacillus haynesii]MCY7993434.1 spore germination protein [Bacillus haynesii]MCY8551217.1 spore germination protein [Bacillus haynesii]MCY8615490.1 spore germination protein [Bacillus haynesii]MCY8651312.1 spore germination protein [Bacillus haynesii]MCY9181638.1 spore germination protein [Bacillus haynesii]
MEKKHAVQKNLAKNVEYLNEKLGVDKSFDMIRLDVVYADRDMSLYLVDGFVKDDIMHHLLKNLSRLTPESLEDDPLEKLVKTYIPYIEIDTEDDLDKAAAQVLSGPAVLLADGVDHAIIIDARTYPARNPEEPDNERVVRGSRDGFVETIVFNTALTRRRIRDRSLRMEFLQVGRRSKTDVVICYLEDIADLESVKKLKQSLEAIDTDALTMAEKTLEEYIGGRHWNPYPTVRYTERPDTAAVHLYEGHILVFVDGSPSALITPVTFWHHMQHAEEYRNKPLAGAYLRMVRFISVLASIFLLPLWFLLSVHPDHLPDALEYIGPEKKGAIPLLVQFIIIEIGVDMMRMAAIHTPSSLATALGLVAALMIGEVAVQVGLFSHEVVLYLAVAAIGTFATPSYELSIANRLARIVLLVAAGAFGPIGFVIAIFCWVIYLVRMKSFQVPYLWPFIPFDYRAFRDIAIRTPMPLKNRRPVFLDPQDPDR